ncbi:MAG: hypothetical protein AB1700_18905 [Bacillota bacterium]
MLGGRGKYQLPEFAAAGLLTGAMILCLMGGCRATSSGASGMAAPTVQSSPESPSSERKRTALELPYGKIDWERGVMVATGRGLPPADAGNTAQRKLLARRAAIVDAERNLARLAAQARSGQATVGQEQQGGVVLGAVQGVQVVSERYNDDGSVEVTMEAPIPIPGAR